jgi:hypothetical protein
MLGFLSRIPRHVTAIGAAALPAAAFASVLSMTNATAPRFFPPEEAAPAPWIVQPAEGALAEACQIAVVVSEASARTAGAPLRLSRVTSEGSAEVWAAVTDRDGGHRFLDLPAGTYQLTALVEGHAPAAAPPWHCTGANERAFFELPLVTATHEVSGRVRSGAGGGAPGAEIAVAQEDDSRTSLAGVARVPVAADGSYAMRLAPGHYVLLVQAPHHAPFVRKLTVGDAPRTNARFALTPAPRVRGRVLDEEGAPIANALVALGGVFDPKQRAPSVRTGADGSFALPVLLGQDVVVTARGAGRIARATLGAAVSPFGYTGIDLVARAGRAVQGVVSKPDGSAWAFGDVRYRIRDLGLSGVEKADGEGRFVLAGMPADVDVEVWAEGNATGAWGAQVASPGRDTLALVYTAPAY